MAKLTPKKLIPCRPHYLEAIPLEIEPGLTKNQILTVLTHTAGKIGSSHAKGQPVSTEYQAAFNKLYEHYQRE